MHAPTTMLCTHRTHSPRIAEEVGERTDFEAAILKLPGRVLAEARDAELAQAVMDSMLKGGLFPVPLQKQDPAARLWVLLWQLSSQEVMPYAQCMHLSVRT